MSNYKETKEWLKQTAKEIHNSKIDFKNQQRENVNNQYNMFVGYNFNKTYNKEYWIKLFKTRDYILHLKYEYRHTHIAMSLFRGKKIEQIERKTNNAPDMSYVEVLLNELKKTICSNP